MLGGGFGLVLGVVFVTCMLFGTGMAQMYTYFTQYTNDRTWMKAMVGVLIVLDIASTFFAMAWQFDILIINWAEPNIEAVQSNWLLALNPLFCGLTGFIVHSFFTWRIYVITGSKALASFIMLFAICAGTGALSTSAIAIMQIGLEQFSKLPFGPMWLVGTALVDALISGSLSYHLRKKRGDFQGTNHILDKLIRMTVQNGLLTAAVAITDLALFLRFKSPNHTVSFLMPKLYVNTVLSSLNSRQQDKPNDSWALSTLESGPTASTAMYMPDRHTMSRISAIPPRVRVNIHVDEDDTTEDLHAAGKHVHDLGRRMSTYTDATGVMDTRWPNEKARKSMYGVAQ